MTDGTIKDWQLAASSALSRADDPQCAVKFARLHQQDGRAWCAAKRAVNEWVLVDLGVASEVSGIVTQGRGDVSEWVTHFMVSYSLDAYKWEFARDIYGTKKVCVVLFEHFNFKHSASNEEFYKIFFFCAQKNFVKWKR